ncbi:MAG: hypothetical protein OEY89_13680 [Gammaproteobacteria bacterium]|nr:hypothetical protein [Gammaproteobacteria bacterium]
MNKFKLLIPLLIVLMNSGCASFGPTVRIETPEPAEDFVVVCEWIGGRGIIAGSGSRESHKVFITESGKEVDCGLGFSSRNNVQVMHPLYANMQRSDENGVSVVRPKNKLQILDEQKAKFEAGFWDKHSDPGAEYADSLVGCGFPHQYSDYYNEVKDVDIERFKLLYNKPISECLRLTMPILKKYKMRKYGGFPDAEYYIERMWDSKKWSKQNE